MHPAVVFVMTTFGLLERCARSLEAAPNDRNIMARAVLATLAEEITDEQMAALGDAIEFADDCEDGAGWCALTALHATLTELRKAAR